jgi:hypothetical protein
MALENVFTDIFLNFEVHMEMHSEIQRIKDKRKRVSTFVNPDILGTVDKEREKPVDWRRNV